ncbi:MAG: TatD family hydrolase [Hominimerdicola sp.]
MLYKLNGICYNIFVYLTRKEVCCINNIFDSHCHYDDHAFDEDRFELLDKLLLREDSSVDKMVHASTDEQSALFGISTAEKYENFYTSIGFHPECLDRLPQDYQQKLEELYQKACLTKKLVAVGEIGLDYHYEGYDKNAQISLFTHQVEFAVKKSLPVIVHCREATEDCLQILSEYMPRGVVHCFSGSAETAEQLLKMGFYVGFTGALTFKNAKKARRALSVVPMDRLLLETDCPYMAPPPYRGQRCESYMIEEIAKVVAQEKGISPQEVLDITNKNACRLFGIA